MSALLRIERAYIEQKGLGPWEEITQDEFLRRTEWSGYFKSGTALLALHDLGELRTPFLYFRVLKANECKEEYAGKKLSGARGGSPHPLGAVLT